jgi:hypothetical protein
MQVVLVASILGNKAILNINIREALLTLSVCL